jgi:hypothetical protein
MAMLTIMSDEFYTSEGKKYFIIYAFSLYDKQFSSDICKMLVYYM